MMMMMMMVSARFILFGLFSLTAALQEYNPSASESKLYLAINPKPSWGSQMRQQKSVRILLHLEGPIQMAVVVPKPLSRRLSHPIYLNTPSRTF